MTTQTTMLETLILPGPIASLHTIRVPTLTPTQLLIHVIYTGTNPKDWKRANYGGQRLNQGDDISGIVHSVGSSVRNFHPGDRVLALHQPGTPGGSFAEYAVSYEFSTAHLPDCMSFEEGATLPMVFNTAAVALYRILGLPMPVTTTLKGKKTPLVVYGASTSVGASTVQLAALSDIHPIIAIAGSSTEYIQQFLDESKGDALLDYRSTELAVIDGIKASLTAAGADKVNFAVDAYSEGTSTSTIASILDAVSGMAHIARVLPLPQDEKLPPGVRATFTISPNIFNDTPAGEGLGDGWQEFAAMMFTLLQRGLERGWMKPLLFEVVKPDQEGGWWTAVEKGLKMLKAGEAKGRKFVVEIGKE